MQKIRSLCSPGENNDRPYAIAAARRRLPMVEADGDELGVPKIVDRGTFQAELDRHTARWRTWRVTFAVFCQGPYEESARYHDFMGWEMPWYSAPRDSFDILLVGRRVGLFHIVCYLRRKSNVFETYWTTGRGGEAMDNSYDLLDLTVYGRQEMWEDSPAGWPRRLKGKQNIRTDGRPTAQWSRLKAGYSDDLTTGKRERRPCQLFSRLHGRQALSRRSETAKGRPTGCASRPRRSSPSWRF